MPFLTVRGTGKRRIHELGTENVVGRGSSCTILLDDPRASKRHAEIVEKAGRYLLRDLKSTNGTLFNGEDLLDEVSLQDGDAFVIGSTELLFTRKMPLGTDVAQPEEEAAAAGEAEKARSESLSDRGGLEVPEKGGRVPRGTLVVPLERFGLGGPHLKGAESTVITGPLAGADVAIWLRALYRLLREANLCESEDELFATATRTFGEAYNNARVRVLFEARGGAEDDEEDDEPSKKTGETTLNLVAWHDPAKRKEKTTRILEDQFAKARDVLLNHARERCVAVLSPDAELDARVAGAKKGTGRITKSMLKKAEEEDAQRERVSFLIAPLLTGRTALGFLVVERTYKLNRGEPFRQEHLEFLAAAAYPLATMLANLRRRQSVLEENERLRRSVSAQHEMVGDSASHKAALSVIQRVAPFDSPVLVTGESGTGKELAARAIHALSRRSKGPFEALNCAALPENLIESELFGHAKGAFTGATGARAGYFETASGGTLFLDEIGELPLPAQAKLLRVLEDGKVARVGESRLRATDVRIVAATNRDLAAEVDAGRFRKDLYYRLRVMDVALPPLRERLDDLPLLCKHLLTPFGNFQIQPQVFELFKRYPWPGNIRELRNTLERMAVLARPGGRGFTRAGSFHLGPNDVPLDIRRALESATAATKLGPPTEPDLRVAGTAVLPAPDYGSAFIVRAPEMPPLNELQVSYARWVLEQVNGNKTKAAKTLGIQRSTLYSWTEWNEKGGGGKGD
ncbi:MAG: sigma 54-interacting transcriptional regulator [Planctomycetes bacterium]|nr:sigma 54-interacting transcriptional regulator [Planctomycetota bacterium]